ncbi:M20/M25/M40 family metallo-hydrolase [Streptacidiphilus sp. P02-A3a]|uniref:M20/M25/M40 family metallo-hydrolase n=1 Tax=Streptacidiphilus sp. P02-A3a TaxID=2704468 RepID=UPI0015FC5301|nr:M20/M25/M40 family metallo-hydrolase [Streptacidiphilus sp. P02-A3a]QMU70034.1 M20/M25/M40 family metallo-hydrolase [Streptacidiphilus sp. P02-A3a]
MKLRKLREYLPGWSEIRRHAADTISELAVRTPHDPKLADALSRITPADVERHVSALTATGPRWREDEQNVQHALRHLRDELSDYGYQVVEKPYGEAPHQVNLFAVLPGRDRVAPLVEVGAHWDSVQGSPGADDNASGVAGVLETARVLHALGPRERGVRFCLFGEEEEWMLGSRSHVADLDADGEAVEGLIVLEMIGFRDRRPGAQGSPLRIPGVFSPPTTGDFVALIADLRSLPFANAVQRSARTYVPGLRIYPIKRLGGLLRDAARSDHLPYWRTGRRGLLITDTANLRNPHYHQATDTLATLDLDFAAEVTRAVAGAVVQLADRTTR